MPALVDPAKIYVFIQLKEHCITMRRAEVYGCCADVPVTDAAGAPFVGDLLGLLLPGKNARGTRICVHRAQCCVKLSMYM